MGLLADVYKNPLGDCTNNGVSSGVQSLCVVNMEGPFNPDVYAPAVMVEEHHSGCLRIVPAMLHGDRWVRKPGHWMMGGNFAATSDSRFSQKCESLLGHRFYGAVAIHDRQE